MAMNREFDYSVIFEGKKDLVTACKESQSWSPDRRKAVERREFELLQQQYIMNDENLGH